MSQPGKRPVTAALVPRIYSVQSPELSSIHLPAPFFLTIIPTRGGSVLERSGLIAGTKFVPLLGGGFRPTEGALGKLTGLGLGNPIETPEPMIVEAFPDSKMATSTFEPSELASIARGRLPSITRFVTVCRL